MKRIELLGLAVAVLVLASCVASAGYLCVPMIDQAQIDRHAAKLVQVSRDISLISQGKERLLIDDAVSPWPAVGEDKSVRDVIGLQAIYGFLSVFPVSSPVETSLPGIGEGKILGAVGTTVEASAPGDQKADPGVYMLFVPTTKGETAGPLQMIWVFQEQLNGRAVYKEAMRTPADTLRNPASTGAFALVNASIRVVDAQVEMRWKTEGYRFLFALGLSWA